MPFRANRFVRAAAISFVALGATPLSAQTLPIPTTAYANVMRSINPHLPLAKTHVYATLLLQDASMMHVDPALMMAIVTVESHWQVGAVSIHGARGLGQLKPETAHELGVDPRSGRGNLRGLAMYLHRMLAMFHRSPQPMRDALAGYNAGPYAVLSYGGIPPNGQTRRYVGKVMTALKTIRKRLGLQEEIDAATGGSALAASDDADPLIGEITRADNAFWGAR